MRDHSYLNFDVVIDRGSGDGEYRARIVAGPGGETPSATFTLPFSALELENLLLKVGNPRRQASRGLGASHSAAIEEFGRTLFDAVFAADMKVTLATSLTKAENQAAGLRVRLHLTEVPELADIPWEFLWDPGQRHFLALSEWTPLVRYLDLPGGVRPLSVRLPLRVLVVVASPSDLVALDTDSELRRLREALGDLEASERVVLDSVPAGSLAALQRKLRRDDYHVFHFIGHGAYDSDLQDGILAFEDANGRSQKVRAGHLAMLLHDHRTLGLAVLNSCEGARSGYHDPYSGTAQTLIRQGVPAVVAMQFEITDDAAIAFSHSLYESIADGYPLDAAVSQARNAIRAEDNQVEWATPVLYLRSPDGRIFDLDQISTSGSQGAPTSQKVLTDDAGYTAAIAAMESERWSEVVRLLTEVRLRYPDEDQVTVLLHGARRRMQLELLDIRARSAVDDGRWPDAEFTLERIVEIDTAFHDATSRLDAVRERVVTSETTMLPAEAQDPQPAADLPKLDDEADLETPVEASPQAYPSSGPDPGWVARHRRRLMLAGGALTAGLVLIAYLHPTSRHESLPAAARGLGDGVILIAEKSGTKSSIVAIDANSGETVRKFVLGGMAELPNISRDRKTLIYYDARASRLRVVSVDGKSDRQLFSHGDGRCEQDPRRPAWDPANNDLAIRCDPGRAGLYLRRFDGRPALPQPIVTGTTRGPTFSPNGKYVAYWSDDKGAVSGDKGLFVVATNGSTLPVRIKSTRGGRVAEPAWSPNGENLAFTQGTLASSKIYRARFIVVAGTPMLSEQVGPLATNGAAHPTWSPDGKQLAFVRGTNLVVMDTEGVEARGIPIVPTDPNRATPVWFSW
jgi:dipeptidyl aminopeptidase/acylaminoacyl peptidase